MKTMIPVFLGGSKVGEMPRPGDVAPWYEYGLDHGPADPTGPDRYGPRKGYISRVRFRGRGGTDCHPHCYPQRFVNPEIIEYGEVLEDGYHEYLIKPASVEHLRMIPSFVG